jgi:hypothetical protein
MKTVILNSENTVVDIIVGDFSSFDQEAFGNHYISLYGDIEFVSVDKNEDVWIGGTYNNGLFSPPYREEVDLIDDEAPTE